MRRKYRWFLAAIILPLFLVLPASAASSNSWPTFMQGIDRTGYNAGESILTTTTVPNMSVKWSDTSGGSISAQPVATGGSVFWGSWDGYEQAANATTGAPLWKTFVGQNTDTNCNPPTVGVASTAAISYATIGGVKTEVDYVGGGDASMYALNAKTGAVIWKTSLGTVPFHFLWASPVVHNGSVYEGLASYGDCPLVRSRLVRLSATTGKILNSFWTTPSNTCPGASVWGSPAIDPATGNVFFGTGNSNSTCTEPYSVALVELNSSLGLVDHWQIPATSQGKDSDFGSTPTLFTATIKGVSTPMVGLANKNGVYYAFSRSSIGSGPVWTSKLAVAGGCPQCGKGDISSSAFDGTNLYVGGGATSISGTACAGSVRAMNPSTGATLWAHCMLSGPVLGPISAIPGVVFAGQGQYLMALNAATGATLFSYQDASASSDFWGSASIVNGVVYMGNMDGTLFAFS